jgi:hypothetical protein
MLLFNPAAREHGLLARNPFWSSYMPGPFNIKLKRNGDAWTRLGGNAITDTPFASRARI